MKAQDGKKIAAGQSEHLETESKPENGRITHNETAALWAEGSGKTGFAGSERQDSRFVEGCRRYRWRGAIRRHPGQTARARSGLIARSAGRTAHWTVRRKRGQVCLYRAE